MITNTMPSLRRTLLSGSIIIAFTLMASGCMASTPSATTQSRNSNASAGKTVAVAKEGHAGSPEETELPPNWPWHGLTITNDGSKGAQPADIDELVKQFGINSAHLYLHLNKFGPRNGLSNAEAWTQSMQWLDSMLARCKKYHLVAIVHLTSFAKPGGGYYNQHMASFWQNPTAVDEIYTEVAALAKHIHSYGYDLVAYDIIGEPVMKSSSGAVLPPGWDKIQDRIIQTIRANDPGRWIVVKVTPWGGARRYSRASPVPFSRVVYSVHTYTPRRYTHQGIRGYPAGVSYPGKIGKRSWDKQTLEKFLTPVVTFQKRHNALIYVGEFSAVRWAPGSGQYLRDLVSIFNSHNWGWSYHSFGGWNGWDPRFDTSYTSSKNASRAAFVGEKSQRWQTLETLFKESQNSGG